MSEPLDARRLLSAVTDDLWTPVFEAMIGDAQGRVTDIAIVLQDIGPATGSGPAGAPSSQPGSTARGFITINITPGGPATATLSNGGGQQLDTLAGLQVVLGPITATPGRPTTYDGSIDLGFGLSISQNLIGGGGDGGDGGGDGGGANPGQPGAGGDDDGDADGGGAGGNNNIPVLPPRPVFTFSWDLFGDSGGTGSGNGGPSGGGSTSGGAPTTPWAPIPGLGSLSGFSTLPGGGWLLGWGSPPGGGSLTGGGTSTGGGSSSGDVTAAGGTGGSSSSGLPGDPTSGSLGGDPPSLIPGLPPIVYVTPPSPITIADIGGSSGGSGSTGTGATGGGTYDPTIPGSVGGQGSTPSPSQVYVVGGTEPLPINAVLRFLGLLPAANSTD